MYPNDEKCSALTLKLLKECAKMASVPFLEGFKVISGKFKEYFNFYSSITIFSAFFLSLNGKITNYIEIHNLIILLLQAPSRN